MRQNRKRKTLHSALRGNRRKTGGERAGVIRIVVGIALLAVLVIGGTLVYDKLREIWIRQCVITDVSRQVEIATGANIKPGVILESFGLRKGANLAQIDFAARREEILARIPNIRAITVVRRLPDRVAITVEEREPVARLAVRGNRATGRVVDDEGIVFRRQTGTQILPTITERTETKPGSPLSERSRAALELLELCRDGDFARLAILDVNTSPTDYLYATLGDYSFAKIAWPGMDDPTVSTRDEMVTQLKNLINAIDTATTGPGTIWNATLKGLAFADTKEPIL